MAGLPLIFLEGNLSEDPEVTFLDSGRALTRMHVICDEVKFNNDTRQWDKVGATEISVSVFGAPGENAAESLRKGDGVVVQGKLKMQTVTVDGATVRRYGVVADHLGPSLRFRKTPHSKDVAKAAPKHAEEDPTKAPF